MHYYGSRVSSIEPKLDLGIKYFSSSSNKEFKENQKSNPNNYKYKIIKIFNNTKDKEIYESYLHQYFDVKLHSKFYNKCNQTPFGHDTTGISIKQTKEWKEKRINKMIKTRSNKPEYEIKEIGLKISKTKKSKTEDEINEIILKKKLTSLKRYGDENYVNKEKTSSKRKQIGIDGLTNFQRSAKKASETKYNDIDENGLNGHQRGTITRTESWYTNGNTYKGLNNPNANIILFYNNLGVIQAIIEDLDEYCKSNNIAKYMIQNSFRNKGEPIYQNITNKNTIKWLYNTGNIKYQGWYAIRLKRNRLKFSIK